MKTYVYLFFCLFSLMGFQACSNDEVDNVKTTTSNDVYLVQSKTNKDNFLALYENPDGIILNVKKININANDKEAIVALSKIDDTYFFTAQAEKEQSVVNILSYNDKILTISQTRNGCSLSIGGAGIIWGTAFGALSMGAGAAASLVFLLMAEALC